MLTLESKSSSVDRLTLNPVNKINVNDNELQERVDNPEQVNFELEQENINLKVDLSTQSQKVATIKQNSRRVKQTSQARLETM